MTVFNADTIVQYTHHIYSTYIIYTHIHIIIIQIIYTHIHIIYSTCIIYIHIIYTVLLANYYM